MQPEQEISSTNQSSPAPLPPNPPAPLVNGTPQQPPQGTPSSGAPVPAPAPASGGGLAIASLVMGILCIIFVWLSFLNLPLSIAAAVTGFAARKSSKSRIAMAGMILGTLGLIISLIIGILAVSLLSNGKTTTSSQQEAVKRLNTSTDCYSFAAAPSYYVNNTPSTAFCSAVLELRGTQDAKGKITTTGVGVILGQLQVEAVRSAETAKYGTTLDEIIIILQKSYFPPQGTIEGKPELIKLDGVPAYKLRLQSKVKATASKDFIVSLKNPAYTKTGVDPVNLFIVSVTTPEDNGSEITSKLISSWKWR